MSEAETIPLADHDEIGRKVLDQPWDIQKAIVTITAHCTAIRDEQPTGRVADLAACISICCDELATTLRGGKPVGEGQTPAARWREEGKEDPHGVRYECERSELAGGHLTDDEVANYVYMDPGINNLTIAKDRIRWLSRRVEQAVGIINGLRTRLARAESSLDTYDEHRDARYWRDFKDRITAP